MNRVENRLNEYATAAQDKIQMATEIFGSTVRGIIPEELVPKSDESEWTHRTIAVTGKPAQALLDEWSLDMLGTNCRYTDIVSIYANRLNNPEYDEYLKQIGESGGDDFESGVDKRVIVRVWSQGE